MGVEAEDKLAKGLFMRLRLAQDSARDGLTRKRKIQEITGVIHLIQAFICAAENQSAPAAKTANLFRM